MDDVDRILEWISICSKNDCGDIIHLDELGIDSLSPDKESIEKFSSIISKVKKELVKCDKRSNSYALILFIPFGYTKKIPLKPPTKSLKANAAVREPPSLYVGPYENLLDLSRETHRFPVKFLTLDAVSACVFFDRDEFAVKNGFEYQYGIMIFPN